jgi:hypothetical protein
MKKILEQVLTNADLRNTAALREFSETEEAFEPWSS